MNVRSHIGIIVAAVFVFAFIVNSYIHNDIDSSSASTGVDNDSQTVFVATDGSDDAGDGSYDNPFRTIRKAVGVALPSGTTRIYPKGDLLLSSDESLPGSKPVKITDGKNVQITKPQGFGYQLLGSPTITGWMEGIPTLSFEIANGNLEITNLGLDGVKVYATAGAGAQVMVKGNKVATVQSAAGDQRFPGGMDVVITDVSATATVANNTFALPEFATDCCSLTGVQIVYQKVGNVSVTGNRFIYPAITGRLGRNLKYQGVRIWPTPADKGSGVRIVNNIFETTRFSSSEKLPSDVGVVLAGAAKAVLSGNNFTKFAGTPTTP